MFSNFNTVLPQFYAQTYSNSIQIYHCNKFIGNKFILLSERQIPVKKSVQRLKKNLHIEYKCIITIGRGGRVRKRVKLVENPSEERFVEHCTNLSRDHFCENSASLLFHSSVGERPQIHKMYQSVIKSVAYVEILPHSAVKNKYTAIQNLTVS